MLAIENHKQGGYGTLEFDKLVAGNEERFCEAVEGSRVEKTRECLGISGKSCRLITGNPVRMAHAGACRRAVPSGPAG